MTVTWLPKQGNKLGLVSVQSGHVLTHSGHVLVQDQMHLECFWSRLDTFWTRLKICFYSFYKKGALTFDFEKLNFTAFLQLIYLNSWVRNVHRTQHWTCFGQFILKGAMCTIIEIALTVRAQNVIIGLNGGYFLQFLMCLKKCLEFLFFGHSQFFLFAFSLFDIQV